MAQTVPSCFHFASNLTNRAKRRIFEATFGEEIDTNGDQTTDERIRAARAEIQTPECPDNSRADLLEDLARLRARLARAKAAGESPGSLDASRSRFRDTLQCLRGYYAEPMPLA